MEARLETPRRSIAPRAPASTAREGEDVGDLAGADTGAWGDGGAGPVLVGCPDARPPAYQAVIGLHRAGLLQGFLTSSYYDPDARWARCARRLAPGRWGRWERALLRRHDPDLPARWVETSPSFDVFLRLESRLGARRPKTRAALARWRTDRFDARLARAVERARPGALLAFSDVGSGRALPLCRRLGVPTALSMVHGDVREERAILEREAEEAPDFFPIYLGDGLLDLGELDWLHERRLRDLELADRIAVPSQHIADTIVGHGADPARVRVVPYAADCQRFRPLADERHGAGCTFLFAGGISQRKGIKYLLEAWRRVRRPGWKLQLLGPLPANLAPLRPYLDWVEPLGRVAHSEMPAALAAADVFVFPSLFEGSAVVTYEALACGLPSIVTPNAGAVARDRVEGFVTPPRDVEALAARMEQLGNAPELRVQMAAAARARALEFPWSRYHRSVTELALELAGAPERPVAHG